MYQMIMNKVEKLSAESFFGIVGLVGHTVNQRNLPPDEYIIKVGIDGGGGFLKVCMNILNIRKEQTKKKFSYSKGACAQAFYDLDVKMKQNFLVFRQSWSYTWFLELPTDYFIIE